MTFILQINSSSEGEHTYKDNYGQSQLAENLEPWNQSLISIESKYIKDHRSE